MKQALVVFSLILTACGTSPGALPLAGDVVGKGTAELRSAQGLALRLTWDKVYENRSSNKPDYITYANPIQVSVNGPLAADAKLRLVFRNKVRTIGQCGLPNKYDVYEYDLDLRATGQNTFAGELNSEGRILWGIGSERKMEPVGWRLPVISHDGYCFNEVSEGQEVSLVVNGEWQVDPINNTHNFQIDLSR